MTFFKDNQAVIAAIALILIVAGSILGLGLYAGKLSGEITSLQRQVYETNDKLSSLKVSTDNLIAANSKEIDVNIDVINHIKATYVTTHHFYHYVDLLNADVNRLEAEFTVLSTNIASNAASIKGIKLYNAAMLSLHNAKQ